MVVCGIECECYDGYERLRQVPDEPGYCSFDLDGTYFFPIGWLAMQIALDNVASFSSDLPNASSKVSGKYLMVMKGALSEHLCFEPETGVYPEYWEYPIAFIERDKVYVIPTRARDKENRNLELPWFQVLELRLKGKPVNRIPMCGIPVWRHVVKQPYPQWKFDIVGVQIPFKKQTAIEAIANIAIVQALKNLDPGFVLREWTPVTGRYKPTADLPTPNWNVRDVELLDSLKKGEWGKPKLKRGTRR